MSALQRFVNWLDRYREVAFDLLRIYLGVGLFVRGVLFLYDPSAFTALLPAGAASWLGSPVVVYLTALVHLLGGALMAVGLLTRVAALIQIPILLGAVLLTWGGLFSADQSFEFSALVLFLLVLIFLHGSGRWSVDHYWHHGRNAFQGVTDALEFERIIGGVPGKHLVREDFPSIRVEAHNLGNLLRATHTLAADAGLNLHRHHIQGLQETSRDVDGV